MAEIGIKELKTEASRVIEQVQAGTSYVVTKRGRPAAVIVPLEDAEDLVLANTTALIDERRRARDDHRKGRTVRLEDLD
jgi:prevent-host-death family protein